MNKRGGLSFGVFFYVSVLYIFCRTYIYLHFRVSLSVITLPIDFVMFNAIHLINDYF